MESTFLQLLGKLIKKENPNLSSLSREELLNYINLHCNYKEQAVSFVKNVNLTAQQTYFEGLSNKNKKGVFSFDILEGKLTYHPKSNTYTFEPSKPVKSLWEEATSTRQTRLKDVLGSRFYKILESAYRIDCEDQVDRNLEKENFELHNKLKKLENK